MAKFHGNITIDTSRLNKIVDGLKDFQKQMPAAYTAALNRTLKHVESKTGRIVRQHYNATAKEIRQSMRSFKATFSRPRAWILVRSRRFTLARFLPGGLASRSRKPRVKIKKSAGRKLVGGTPPAFVQRAPDGNTHIFRRRGKSRFPIDVLRTISPTQMIENLQVADEIRRSAEEVLEKRLHHELNRRLQKVKGDRG